MLSSSMGRLSVFRALVGVMLVGSVALAQQGLIVEPWRKAPTPAAAPVPPLRAMPGPVSPAAPLVRPPSAAALPAPAQAQNWSPPVVELLVDPWSRGQVAAPAARPRWVPSSVEIVDPWPDHVASEPPRAANRPAGAQHSTIF